MLGVTRPVAAVMAAGVVDVTRASVSAVVIAVAIVGASVTLRPHGHTANKKMTLASTSWDNDNVDFLTISEDFVILRGLLQDHGQDNNAGGVAVSILGFKFSQSEICHHLFVSQL